MCSLAYLTNGMVFVAILLLTANPSLNYGPGKPSRDFHLGVGFNFTVFFHTFCTATFLSAGLFQLTKFE